MTDMSESDEEFASGEGPESEYETEYESDGPITEFTYDEEEEGTFYAPVTATSEESPSGQTEFTSVQFLDFDPVHVEGELWLKSQWTEDDFEPLGVQGEPRPANRAATGLSPYDDVLAPVIISIREVSAANDPEDAV